VTRAIEECAALALAALSDDAAQRFANDPEQSLRDDLGLTVQAVDHLEDSRTEGGTCDGISYLTDRVILYRRTGNRRENFTLAHELGHWLVDRTDAVYDTLAQYDDAAKMLESVCDRIARVLLLPDYRVTDILGSAPVEAAHVMALYEGTNASVHACTIALKDRLPGLGAVVVLDRAEETVRYASIRPDDERGWPVVHPWPGQSLPAGHPLRSVRPGGTLRQRTFWENQWGKRDDFYVDAIGYSNQIIAVFSDDDPWQAEKFHPKSTREFDQRPTLEIRCCGQVRTIRGWPCPDCGEGFCPICGNCRCGRHAAVEVLCAGSCYLKYLPHLLVNGLCEECR